MKRVSLVALPGCLGASIAIPLDMLAGANDIARAQRREELRVDLHVLGTDRLEFALSGGLRIKCDNLIDAAAPADLIFIPGVWGSPRVEVRKHGHLLEWLRKEYERGAILCAITTGSHFLAASGLLDGKAATTHWRYFDQFHRDFPAVKLQRKRFITAQDRLYCTGSVNAARDLMLHFIEQLYGGAVVTPIARHFTHELKRSYESMLLDENPQSTHHDEEIIKVQEWLQEHHADAVNIADVAARFGMSLRSLNRRFRLAANTTPVQYLQETRIHSAKELLKQSNLDIAGIADQVGYSDASYFTALFRRLNSVTPRQYRSLVRNKLFLVEGKRQDY